MTLQAPLTSLEQEALAVIQSTISHRLKFSQERVALAKNWLTGAEKLVEEVSSGKHRISKDTKEVKSLKG